MKHKVIVLVESALDEVPGDRCVHIAQRAEEWEAEFVVGEGLGYIYPYLAVREIYIPEYYGRHSTMFDTLEEAQTEAINKVRRSFER
jgi:hypothetical protein